MSLLFPDRGFGSLGAIGIGSVATVKPVQLLLPPGRGVRLGVLVPAESGS